MSDDLDVVTGAFGYSGAAIARELMAEGRRVRTLTAHPERAPAGSAVEARPLDFDNPLELVESLRGARTLYNTYWIRFGRGRVDHALAVHNSRTLFDAARIAGVRHIVHLSITHPSLASPYSYFRGKAEVERALLATGLPHTVLRPAILFGGDGVLIHNIAWLLRRLPVFAIGGSGAYRVRGIHVDDLARLCVRHGAHRPEWDGSCVTLDAVGPDRPAFLELVQAVRSAVGSRAVIVRYLPGSGVTALSGLLGTALRDVLLTRDEYAAMADGLADTDGPATGDTSLLRWVSDNAQVLGRRYVNELQLHYR
ncbi:SDR family oxidoreductase [Actinomadura rupiterrae]|uniref:SDR family oxidoreductase n=1 Tax=Actinomadura rupiterrae TaxID=559627 RepID=UPI0020A23E8D|nr:NAD(P)H-binding protein [Actinomadura rupiterrae]MCP2343844.1 NADH dehydrogenase [Actinomadura rupiterrae]